ncbi:hypothetical protein [Streptomyces sp. NPDC046978]
MAAGVPGKGERVLRFVRPHADPAHQADAVQRDALAGEDEQEG